MGPDREPGIDEAVARLPERIAFLGLGLIGGSIALALRRAGSTARISAWTPAGRGPAEAAAAGVIDEAAATPEAAVDGAGLVVLAGPPLAILDTLERLARRLRAALNPGVVITDVASTKVRIVERAGALGLPFVGGHPMAGRETSGFGAASADLFDGRPWVVIGEGEDAPPDRRLVMDLARACGATAVTLPAAEHDAAVAAVSHLPLVLSAALVESVAAGDGPGWRSGRGLAASGWRDMSRLARGDAEMGAGILATNAGPVREGLLAVRDVLDQWILQLDGDAPDAGPLRDRLERARLALEAERGG